MTLDKEMVQQVYSMLATRIDATKSIFGNPLTLTEKILYSHLFDAHPQKEFERGKSYVNFAPDRVAMQDATAQMALLQFMQAGKNRVSVPSTVHCDHLILAQNGAKSDLNNAFQTNKEVYDFLESVSLKYGIGFWKPGAGIIHQVVLENYAFPGGMMIGTDSHTPNAGGLAMLAIGVGGADAVDVMIGMPWELLFPKIIGVKLTGRLSGWSSPKDVILKLAGLLTVKGGTGAIIEYFGEGTESISCTGKGTICNMGAEIGATTSIFPYDLSMKRYLEITGRADVVEFCESNSCRLRADEEVYNNPSSYYDKVIEINLSELEPHINGPFTPDLATPVSQFGTVAKQNNWPLKLEVGLIGSCTNSSYEDISRAASIAKQALDQNLEVRSEFTVTPGSEQVRYTLDRDGYLETLTAIGGKVLANACGPCIGQWARHNAENLPANSIMTSFNRNFAKRNDGNPKTHGFVASPEIVTAFSIAGTLDFNPLTDTLVNREGIKVKLREPQGVELPTKGFEVKDNGFSPPQEQEEEIKIKINPDSERLQLLSPFAQWSSESTSNLVLLIKAKGKCTTDHISMAGPWLRFRGHLDNISNNLLMGAVNSFTEETNSVKNQLTGSYAKVSETSRYYLSNQRNCIVVGDENYGEGSSREHAAMEPRHVGVTVVLVKSFARIHETNLKKQGVLAVTFANPSDYDLILEADTFTVLNIDNFSPKTELQIEIKHADSTTDIIDVLHTYNDTQIEWFKAGSCLNYIKLTEK